MVKKNLFELRNALLDLHKVLADSERVGYESTMGTIQSPNQYLQLLTGDPWFAWLHPLSQLVVAIDDAMDGKEPLTGEVATAFARQTRTMLVATDSGHGFSEHYYEALQRDPDVIMAHARVVGILAVSKSAS